MKSAPLITWIYSLFFIAFIFIIALLLPTKNEPLPINLHLERLQTNIKADKEVHIAIIGTSLTGCGIFPDDEFESLAMKMGSKPFQFFRFAKSGRDLEAYDELFERLQHSNIDLVLIEARLLCYTDKNKAIFDNIRNKIINIVKKPFHQKDTKIYTNVEDLIQQAFKDDALKKRPTNYLQVANAKRICRDFPPTKKVDQFLTYAQKHNITVVFVDFPFAQEVESIYPNDLKEYEVHRIQQYHDKYHTSYISFDDNLSQIYFRDLCHANQKGREYISYWLIHKLQGYLK